MARGVQPECRYGHGPLQLSVLEARPGDAPGTQYAFTAISMFTTPTGPRLDFGRVFSFEIWHCKTCSYIELHDSDPKQGL